MLSRKSKYFNEIVYPLKSIGSKNSSGRFSFKFLAFPWTIESHHLSVVEYHPVLAVVGNQCLPTLKACGLNFADCALGELTPVAAIADK